ncbi:MAG: cobyric acid synthase [Rhodoglobus sp.]
MSAVVTILELYPEHLAINGDMGNVRVLRRRLELAGHAVQVLGHAPGDTIPGGIDLIAIGSGPVSALRAIAADIGSLGTGIRTLVDDGVPLLAVGGGFHVLGQELVLGDGEMRGAGVFDMVTDATAPRVVTGAFIVDTALGRLIGIENHGATITLADGQAAFGVAVTGRGNGDGAEGASRANAMGTHLHGPVLAMNPVLADHLIGRALTRRGLSYQKVAEHERLDALALETRVLLAPDSALERGATR